MNKVSCLQHLYNTSIAWDAIKLANHPAQKQYYSNEKKEGLD